LKGDERGMRTRARQRIWIEMVAEPHLPRSEMDIHVQPEPFEHRAETHRVDRDVRRRLALAFLARLRMSPVRPVRSYARGSGQKTRCPPSRQSNL
jgi:hypothetical protein